MVPVRLSKPHCGYACMTVWRVFITATQTLHRRHHRRRRLVEWEAFSGLFTRRPVTNT